MWYDNIDLYKIFPIASYLIYRLFTGGITIHDVVIFGALILGVWKAITTGECTFP